MKLSLTRLAAVLATAAALFSVNAKAIPIAFDYANTTNSTIKFDGASHFSFNPGLNSFQITSGSALGLLGDIGGTFTIGAITGSTASVTGTGSFVIHDGLNNLTADVTWLKLSQVGVGGILNVDGNLNLTNIAYSGFNSDLLALKNAGSAINTVTFQFSHATNISTLKTTAKSTSFSGSVATAPDGGTTLLLMGLGLSGVAFIGRKRKTA